MECIIVAIVGMISLTINYAYKKSFYNASGIFSIMWTICLGLSTLGLYGLNTPSPTVVFLGCATMLIFTFSNLLRTKLITVGEKPTVYDGEYVPLTKSFLLYVLNLIAYVFSIPYLIKAVNIIKTAGMYGLRNVAFASSEYASTSVLIIFQTIIGPLFVVTMLLTAIDLSRKFVVRKAIIITIFDVALYTILFGGRYMFFQLLVFFVFAMYDGYGGKLKVFLKKHKKIVLFSLLIVLVMVFITQSRTTRGFFESIYVYFCGSYSYLSYLVDNKIGTDLFLLGRTQFGFIYNFLFLVVSFLTNIDYRGSNHIVTQLTQYTVKIGDGISYNSLGTMLHDFMADYGVYGSLFGVFLFGYACKYVEDSKKRTERSFYYALNIYFLYSTVNSVLGYTFRGPGTLMILIYIYIFCRGKK